MIQKPFCDGCGESMQAAYLAGASMPALSWPKAKLVVKVSIVIENHPTGYLGPPDICNSCKAKLLKKLYEANKK